jgi:hypothetical protein
MAIKASLENIPYEILVQIFDEIPAGKGDSITRALSPGETCYSRQSSLLRLSSCSRRLHNAVAPMLYHTIHKANPLTLLRTFLHRPNLVTHVKELHCEDKFFWRASEISPFYPGEWERFAPELRRAIQAASESDEDAKDWFRNIMFRRDRESASALLLSVLPNLQHLHFYSHDHSKDVNNNYLEEHMMEPRDRVHRIPLLLERLQRSKRLRKQTLLTNSNRPLERLTRLEFSQGQPTRNRSFSRLLPFLALKSLTEVIVHDLNAVKLDTPATVFPNIIALELWNCQIHRSSMSEFLSSFPNLKYFSCEYSRGTYRPFQGKVVWSKALVKAKPCLRQLSVFDQRYLDDVGEPDPARGRDEDFSGFQVLEYISIPSLAISVQTRTAHSWQPVVCVFQREQD